MHLINKNKFSTKLYLIGLILISLIVTGITSERKVIKETVKNSMLNVMSTDRKNLSLKRNNYDNINVALVMIAYLNEKTQFYSFKIYDATSKTYIENLENYTPQSGANMVHIDCIIAIPNPISIMKDSPVMAATRNGSFFVQNLPANCGNGALNYSAFSSR